MGIPFCRMCVFLFDGNSLFDESGSTRLFDLGLSILQIVCMRIRLIVGSDASSRMHAVNICTPHTTAGDEFHCKRSQQSEHLELNSSDALLSARTKRPLPKTTAAWIVGLRQLAHLTRNQRHVRCGIRSFSTSTINCLFTLTCSIMAFTPGDYLATYTDAQLGVLLDASMRVHAYYGSRICVLVLSLSLYAIVHLHD